MPRDLIDANGMSWSVALSGRRTQYTRDEISLAFTPTNSESGGVRFARFSPQGAKSPELAYEEATDALLRRLLEISQPAWTSPDGAYAPTG
jgi:hypothetical protein